MTFSIRGVEPTEAERLAKFGAMLFRQAYEDTHPEPTLGAYLAKSFDVQRVSRMLEDPASIVLVVEEQGTWIGYAELHIGGPTTATTVLTRELPGSNPMEIVRFYVDQAWHGKGVAHAFMQACDDRARTKRCDVLWLQAWQRAPQALRFYHKAGFEIYGTAVFTFGDRVDNDFILARALNATITK